MKDSFDSDIAKTYGIGEAILIKYFYNFIMLNKSLKINHHKNRYWFYGSTKFISKSFEYYSIGQIKKIIDSLIEQNVLIKENFNKKNYDRTSWYSFKKNSFIKLLDEHNGGKLTFKEEYLTPKHNKKFNVQIEFEKLTNKTIRWGDVEICLKKLSYKMFLNTFYWKIISKYIKQKGCNRCSMCGSKIGIQVHHLTYEHHGNELHNLSDLICVCKKCHNKIHKIK